MLFWGCSIQIRHPILAEHADMRLWTHLFVVCWTKFTWFCSPQVYSLSLCLCSMFVQRTHIGFQIVTTSVARALPNTVSNKIWSNRTCWPATSAVLTTSIYFTKFGFHLHTHTHTLDWMTTVCATVQQSESVSTQLESVNSVQQSKTTEETVSSNNFSYFCFFFLKTYAYWICLFMLDNSLLQNFESEIKFHLDLELC